ncbi:nucleotide-binding domain-containing protein [Backusella circina FSU 941]|nr:nucleotide-binding domain-containing protein [Backusella circina FSU 941]
MTCKCLGNVTVIGAGVIGLTTALLLQKEGYNVTIVANHFPGDKDINYTSPLAGARWKTVAPNTDSRLQRYDAVSFKFFWELAKSKAADAGIMIVPGYEYFDEANEDQKNPWWKSVVPSFQYLQKEELPEGISFGYYFTTVLISPGKYLSWLQTQFLNLGGKRCVQNVESITDVTTDDVDIVVNCTGLGAKNLVGDQKVSPTRGQNIVVRAQHIRKTVSIIKKDSYTYIIPRSDGTVILGTSKQENSSDPKVNYALTKDIIDRAYKYCPELTFGKGTDRLEIVDQIVGLRPTRKGGPRVENQFIHTNSGKQVLVTHNYGHDGSGYQSSWGSCQEAVQFVQQGHAVLLKQKTDIKTLLAHL